MGGYNLLLLVHVLAVVLWVGGMGFAHFFLRPAVQALEPPQRLTLMRAVLQRFLAAAGIAVLVVLASGGALLALGATGRSIHAMTAGGVVMAAVYGHVRFALYPRLARAVAAQPAWQWVCETCDVPDCEHALQRLRSAAPPAR